MADAGIMSRRAAEEEIKNGNVSVNGHVASIGTKIDPSTDVVTYKGKRIRYEKRKYTYIYYVRNNFSSFEPHSTLFLPRSTKL